MSKKSLYSLAKYQTGGGRPPIYTQDPNDERLKMYSDSLNLYKAYKYQKKNMGPVYDQWLNSIGNASHMDPKQLKNIRDANGWTPGKVVEPGNSTSDYNKPPSYFTQFDPLTNLEKDTVVNYYKSLPFNYPTKIGMHVSSDLWHSKINPIAEYTDGLALSPVYKKPVQPVVLGNPPVDNTTPDPRSQNAKPTPTPTPVPVQTAPATPVVSQARFRKQTTNFGQTYYWAKDAEGRWYQTGEIPRGTLPSEIEPEITAEQTKNLANGGPFGSNNERQMENPGAPIAKGISNPNYQGQFLPFDQNADGSKRIRNSDNQTEYTIGISTPFGEFNIPTVVNGVQLSQQEAVDRFKKTGEHTGKYNTQEEADLGSESREKVNIAYGSTGLYNKGGQMKKSLYSMSKSYNGGGPGDPPSTSGGGWYREKGTWKQFNYGTKENIPKGEGWVWMDSNPTTANPTIVVDPNKMPGQDNMFGQNDERKWLDRTQSIPLNDDKAKSQPFFTTDNVTPSAIGPDFLPNTQAKPRPAYAYPERYYDEIDNHNKYYGQNNDTYNNGGPAKKSLYSMGNNYNAGGPKYFVNGGANTPSSWASFPPVQQDDVAEQMKRMSMQQGTDPFQQKSQLQDPTQMFNQMSSKTQGPPSGLQAVGQVEGQIGKMIGQQGANPYQQQSQMQDPYKMNFGATKTLVGAAATTGNPFIIAGSAVAGVALDASNHVKSMKKSQIANEQIGEGNRQYQANNSVYAQQGGYQQQFSAADGGSPGRSLWQLNQSDFEMDNEDQQRNNNNNYNKGGAGNQQQNTAHVVPNDRLEFAKNLLNFIGIDGDKKIHNGSHVGPDDVGVTTGEGMSNPGGVKDDHMQVNIEGSDARVSPKELVMGGNIKSQIKSATGWDEGDIEKNFSPNSPYNKFHTSTGGGNDEHRNENIQYNAQGGGIFGKMKNFSYGGSDEPYTGIRDFIYSHTHSGDYRNDPTHFSPTQRNLLKSTDPTLDPSDVWTQGQIDTNANNEYKKNNPDPTAPPVTTPPPPGTPEDPMFSKYRKMNNQLFGASMVVGGAETLWNMLNKNQPYAKPEEFHAKFEDQNFNAIAAAKKSESQLAGNTARYNARNVNQTPETNVGIHANELQVGQQNAAEMEAMRNEQQKTNVGIANNANMFNLQSRNKWTRDNEDSEYQLRQAKGAAVGAELGQMLKAGQGYGNSIYAGMALQGGMNAMDNANAIYSKMKSGTQVSYDEFSQALKSQGNIATPEMYQQYLTAIGKG